MGFNDEASMSKMPTPLGRSTENRASDDVAAYRKAFDNKDDPGKETGSSLLSSCKDKGKGQKRRLTPMELKQQQRAQKEQRTRAQSVSTTPVLPVAVPSPGDLVAKKEPDAENGAIKAVGKQHVRSPGGAPLQRSASSPPSISCPKGRAQGRHSQQSTASSLAEGTNRRLPPPKRRPRFMDRRITRSEVLPEIDPSHDDDDDDDDDNNIDAASRIQSTNTMIDDVIAGDGVSNGLGDGITRTNGDEVQLSREDADIEEINSGSSTFTEELLPRRRGTYQDKALATARVQTGTATNGGLAKQPRRGSKRRPQTRAGGIIEESNQGGGEVQRGFEAGDSGSCGSEAVADGTDTSTVVGSRGGGGEGASLFSMVMSGASTSSNSSRVRGCVGREGRSSAAMFASSRAEGGTVSNVTSTLSGLLRRNPSGKDAIEDKYGGERATKAAGIDNDDNEDESNTIGASGVNFAVGQALPERSECDDAPSVIGVRDGGRGVIARDSGDDWMAMNLEKLSSFRVPETRMGYPEASSREGLKRSATAPVGGGRGRHEGGVFRGDDRRRPGTALNGTSRKSSRYLGDRHWQIGSQYPLGSCIPDTNKSQSMSTITTETTDSSAEELLERGDNFNMSLPSTYPPAVDLPLRTRVRFEMAPGVPVPAGVSGVPGHLEFRALKAFAAGDVDFASGISVNRRQSEKNEVSTGNETGADQDAEGVDGMASSGGQSAETAVTERGAGGDDGVGYPGGAAGAAEIEAAVEAAALEATVVEEREEAMEQWRKATLYWAHPAAPLPQEALATQKAAHVRIAKNPVEATKARGAVHPGGSASPGWTSFFLSRRRDWEQAFASLYYALVARRREHNRHVNNVNLHRNHDDTRKRGGRGCSNCGGGREGFYLQCPRYTVLWRLVPEAQGEASDAPNGRLMLSAVMTQSTRRLRKRLVEAGVEFEMPLDPAGDQRDAPADEDVLQEWKALDATGNAKAGATYANEEDRSRPHLSLLVFKGHMAVHGLFDFLLENCSSPMGMGGGGSGVNDTLGISTRRRGVGNAAAGRASDVPLLLSREPFLNASLKALKVRQNGLMHRSKAKGSSAESSDVQVLELVGHVLPSALSDLAHTMARACTASSHSQRCKPRSDLDDDQRGIAAESRDTPSGDDSEMSPWEGAGVGEEGGKELFRAVLSVDPGTSHLNAAFRPLETPVTAAAGTATNRGVGDKSPEIVPGRGDYCSETRARISPRESERSFRGGCVVFDVCSAEPSVTAPF